jgi:hypothetical protein
MKAKKPRRLKNQNFERNLGPSLDGRRSSDVRGKVRSVGHPTCLGIASTFSLPCREELPTIYKCPYQGCTAVYRGADGMKVRSGCLLGPGIMGSQQEHWVFLQSQVQTAQVC